MLSPANRIQGGDSINSQLPKAVAPPIRSFNSFAKLLPPTLDDDSLCISLLRKGVSRCGDLHHQAAAAALLRRIGVFAPRHGSPDRRHHVVFRAVAVRDNAIETQLAKSGSKAKPIIDHSGASCIPAVTRLQDSCHVPLRRAAHGDPFPLKILAQPVVQLC